MFEKFDAFVRTTIKQSEYERTNEAFFIRFSLQKQKGAPISDPIRNQKFSFVYFDFIIVRGTVSPS